MAQEFASKIDTWLLIILLITILASIVSGILIINKRNDFIGYGSSIILILICGVLPVWFLLNTNYTVTNDNLIIKSGPKTWNIPIANIASIEETRESWSSPALSLDRLKIHYGNGNWVMISPKNKEAFLKAIGHEK